MNKSHLIFTFTIALFWIKETCATPYITPHQWTQIQPTPVINIKFPAVTISTVKDRLRLLTDQGFCYLFEYIQICDFIKQWQVSDTSSSNYGGMIEGESGDLTTIVETDNTQEAIRVWSHYALITGDLERYRNNITAAWIYTMNFPAYLEEGETDYYRVHNCGWGLVAQMEYLEVYGDTTYHQYADSCAEYIIAHPLSFYQGDPFYQQLHPLVTGWAAGTLYQYGEYVGNQSFVDNAVILGEQVKAWIEENPLRLSSNEVWAMSGGTAMWGVVNSVFREDSSAGVLWLETYAPYMDTYSGPGTWNNSWNIWYSHAHRAIYDLVGDSLYQYYAVTLVDTILEQDTDNDGGVPAGSVDPDTMDQTWISCYTDYMGIEKILWTLPQYDAGVVEFVSPQTGIPIVFGSTVPISVIVANFGELILDSVNVMAQIAPNFSGNGIAILSSFAQDTVELTPYWTPADTGYHTIFAYTSLPQDQNPGNDTASVEVEIRGSGTLAGTVTDGETGCGLFCQINFYHQEVSNITPYAQTLTQMPDGNYTLDLMAGEYRAEVEPQIPYNVKDFASAVVQAGVVNDFNMTLTPAPVLLVDDDGGNWYDNFIINALGNLAVEYYHWDNTDSGAVTGKTTLFPMCIWITGNENDSTLLPVDKDELVVFLESGGNLILSGQNIGDDLGPGDPFLNQYLKADHETDNVSQQFLNGITGNSISNGTSLLLVGSTGASNQTSPASCIPLAGGEAVYRYQNAPNPIGAVSYEDELYQYHSLYFSFGIEAVSGLANTLPLSGLLNNIFTWMGFEMGISPEASVPPLEFSLNSIYPNPFNPTTTISYTIHRPGLTELALYNVLGQKVILLWAGNQPAGNYEIQWSAKDEVASGSSGIYVCRLNFEGQSATKLMLLLK